MFLPPVALATLGLALLLGKTALRPISWTVLALLALVLAENIAAIVMHEIGWAQRQGAAGTGALLGGLAASVSRLPYWLALAVPVAIAGASLRLR
jgi:hypothetical protein